MTTKTPPAPLSVWRPINIDTFLLGVPHYPEHVDESYWERDAQRMKEAGFNSVRMGEFAWHIFEPKENTFDFDLFDRAIAVLGKHGVKTIMCTPTATPPRWLTYHYPEVLRVDGSGRQASHGSRQHGDTTSPVYRTHSQRITRAMAEHYRDNPDVIGWQTDNELNTSESRSYSEATRREFQKFLEDKYGNIGALNHAWGGDFWATAYQNFDQIVLPFDHNPVFPSPGHVQDYHRFLAFSVARFQHDQVVILRDTNPDWFIFHNLGRLDDIDFRGQFSTDLDFVGYDIYPLLYDEMQRNGGAAHAQAIHLDVCRGFSGNFIVPEQQSGFGAQPIFSTMTPEPGEMRRMAYSSVARGADGVMFFRWRPAHFGAEIYWMGIIDHDDVPRRRYDEATQFAQEINAIKDQILGTSVAFDVGIAGSDFDNQEAHRTYPMGLPSPHDEGVLLHRYCYDNGISCGFIHPEDDLSRLKVLYVPHWLIWKDEWTDHIEAFARSGGTVILSARTGSRDEHNHIIRDAAPGKSLTVLAGVAVEEFGRLAPVDGDGLFPLGGRYGAAAIRKQFPAESSSRKYTLKVGNQEMTAGHMYELLELSEGTETRGIWSNRFAEGRAAISLRKVGKGRVIYSGTYLTDALIESLLAEEFAIAGVEQILADKPEGIEVVLREAEDRKLLFVLNTTHEPITVNNLPAGTVLVGDEAADGGLGPYGCLVLRLL
ncbi:beta-galactosidase [Devosia sp. Root685]|uniref:beta-galactosidase n=1 Tax=Devosia sp. Root685 TaxID=1736587 RepID=UPI000701C5EE|nr:beta-galactosidase [Devosia sp. Root685]KRA98034.1 beta-galactosidase [Devosia sp. Root685]